MQQTGLWVQCHSPVSVKPSCCVKPLSHRTLSHTGCQTACALQKTHCVFIKLSAWLKAMYPTARAHTWKFCAKYHYVTYSWVWSLTTSTQAMSRFLHAGLTRLQSQTRTLCLKHRGSYLKAQTSPAKPTRKLSQAYSPQKKQWEEFYFQHPITSVRHT